jgi:hypothetical protein
MSSHRRNQEEQIMSKSVMVLAGSLILGFSFPGNTHAAPPDPTVIRYGGSATLTPQERELLIQEALRLLNDGTSQFPDDTTAEDQGAGALDGKGQGKGKRHHRHRVGGSSSGIAKGDFNGDGFADLAIGIPDKDTPSTVQNSGAIVVIYGSTNGLVAPTSASTIPNAQFWSQNAPGVPGDSVAGDGFGTALASGDFNGDHISDLAIGIPGKDITVPGLFGPTTFTSVGRVVVIYGSKDGGLNTSSSAVVPAQSFDFTQGGRSDKLQNNVELGRALAWGDFNGDGIGDLAIGAPGFSPLAVFQQSAGAVWILYGSLNNGLTTFGNQFFTQDDIGVGGGNDPDDFFGSSLAAGDFNGDGSSDLAIGVPFEDSGFLRTTLDSGRVIVLYGSINEGLSKTGAQSWDADNDGTDNETVSGAEYGAALAAGDFNGDGRSDLAIGAPGETALIFLNGLLHNQVGNSGGVHVLYGSHSGLSTSGSQVWSQGAIAFSFTNLDFPFFSEPGAGFGSSLAAGDFNADGRTDLAIGSPFATVTVGHSDIAQAGEVTVLYGSSPSGLTVSAHSAQSFHEGNLGGTPRAGDNFGSSLTAWNFGRNETILLGIPPNTHTITFSTADLAIGVPNKAIGGVTAAGAINVIYGSGLGNGLVTNNAQLWFEGQPGIPTAAVAFDGFGSTLY